jgi:hypothetical protein
MVPPDAGNIRDTKQCQSSSVTMIDFEGARVTMVDSQLEWSVQEHSARMVRSPRSFGCGLARLTSLRVVNG